jgi:hypothetical protein
MKGPQIAVARIMIVGAVHERAPRTIAQVKPGREQLRDFWVQVSPRRRRRKLAWARLAFELIPIMERRAI